MLDWDAIPWKQTRHDGVRVHFYASDTATGRVVALIGMQQGRGYPAHRHQGPEEVLVLQGGYRDAMGEHLQGQFVRYEDGTTHAPVALEGGSECILFAVAHEGIALLDS